jgi:hypothetical protein
MEISIDNAANLCWLAAKEKPAARKDRDLL